MFETPGLARTSASKALVIFALLAGTTGAEAQAPAPLDIFCNRTLHLFDGGHGNQIEFFSPDGTSYLWYPTDPVPVPGEWRMERAAEGGVDLICFRYPEWSFDPVNNIYGGEWSCAPFVLFLSTRVPGGDLQGDPFGLSTGEFPFPLPAFPQADVQELLDRLPDDFAPPSYVSSCDALLS